MPDKIKLKANKFVNDKKLKLNYIKPKDLKILLTEFCEEQIAELKAECDLAIEGRDIRIAELTEQNTSLLTSVENLNKSVQELEKENVELIGKIAFLENDLNNAKAQIEKMKSDVKANIKWADEHENNQMYFKLNSMFNQWEIKEK